MNGVDDKRRGGVTVSREILQSLIITLLQDGREVLVFFQGDMIIVVSPGL